MKRQILLIILKFSVLFLLIFVGINCWAQNVVNNGANIVVVAGTNVIIGGSYYNINDGVSDGKVGLDGNIILKRDWVNYANNGVMVGVGSSPAGNVIMNGTIKQFIMGSHPTLFENLVLQNSKKILKISNCKVNDTLVVDAVLDLNTNKIKLLNSKPSAIKHVSNYIQSETNSFEGYGEVEWYVGQELDTYKVPFGSGFDSVADLSVTLTTTSMGSPAGGSISFATYPTGCQNSPLPSVVYELDRSFEYIADRYWLIDPFYEEKPGVDIILQYRTQDMNEGCNGGLKEPEMKAIRYNTLMQTWGDMAPRGNSNPDENRFYIKGVSPDDFYAPWSLVGEFMGWEIFFPNAFTPNDDGINDYFSPIGYNLDKLEVKMYIYDRWGALIYVMDDINKPWNGKLGKSSSKCQQGIYSWVLSLKDTDGMDHNYRGIVALIH